MMPPSCSGRSGCCTSARRTRPASMSSSSARSATPQGCGRWPSASKWAPASRYGAAPPVPARSPRTCSSAASATRGTGRRGPGKPGSRCRTPANTGRSSPWTTALSASSTRTRWHSRRLSLAPPTWAVGQVLTAADVNGWLVPQCAIKTSGFTATSNTTLANDPHLILPVAANAIYDMMMFLWYEGGTLGSSDLKAAHTTPASTNWNVHIIAFNGAGNDVSRLSWQNGSTPFIWGTEGAGNMRGVQVRGLISTSSTSGNIQWQFAQNTSSATTTTVHSQSYMTLQRVG